MNAYKNQSTNILNTTSSNRKRVSVTEIKILPNENKRKFAAAQQQTLQQQQREKNQAKRNGEINQQRNFAKLDDHLKWSTCYADDIYEYWKTLECNRTFFDLSAEFFSWRPNQLNALKYLVKKYHFTNLTLHLAIYILDTFLSKNHVRKDERKLTIIACFIVAAKVEEYELKIPTLEQLNASLIKIKNERFYTLEEYENFEVKILRCLQFKLTIPTVATFANFFARSTVNMDDFLAYNVQEAALAARGYSSLTGLFNSVEHMLNTVNSLLFHLVDLSCEISFLRNSLPSQMAAACVYAARRLNNVNPYWSISLATVTQYDETDVIVIAKPIMEVYTKQLII